MDAETYRVPKSRIGMIESNGRMANESVRRRQTILMAGKVAQRSAGRKRRDCCLAQTTPEHVPRAAGPGIEEVEASAWGWISVTLQLRNSGRLRCNGNRGFDRMQGRAAHARTG